VFNDANMEVARDIPATRAAVAAARRAGRTIGLVPTMGALHAGHLSLVEAARRDGTFVVVSIFVNPTQFVAGEDFDRYPRDEQRDLDACRAAGVDAVFAPPTDVMYRPDATTAVSVGGLAEGLCGAFRPGHFTGVATVVAKLLNVVQPDRAYFGEKDYQQLQVIRRMVRDLDLPVTIVGCSLVREPDGLAMSSRNRYMSAAERAQALCLHRALQTARTLIGQGERDAARVVAAMHEVIRAAGPARIDYISIVDPDTLIEQPVIAGPVVVALAVRIGTTRLIDNLRIEPPGA
jgi:pantoate--beta-alanine ligase